MRMLAFAIQWIGVLAIGGSLAYGVATYTAEAVSSSLNESAALIERAGNG